MITTTPTSLVQVPHKCGTAMAGRTCPIGRYGLVATCRRQKGRRKRGRLVGRKEGGRGRGLSRREEKREACRQEGGRKREGLIEEGGKEGGL